MKKLLLSVAMLAMTATMVSAQQNQSKWAVGANVGFSTTNSQLGVGAKVRYGLTEQVRLDGGVTYFLPSNGVTSLEFVVNGHYLFPLNDSKFTLYPLAGIGYYRNSVEGTTQSTGNFLIDFGGGASYQLSEKFSIGAEAKYYLISGLNTPSLSVNAMFTL